MNSKLYYIGLGLALSAVLWGTMILVLVPFAYGDEFGSSTITNSTSTTNSTTTPVGCSRPAIITGTVRHVTYSSSSESTRPTSDYAQLAILLSIVLVAVLASIAYFRRKK